MRNQPMIQVRIGSQQMKDEDLTDNAMTILRTLDGKLKRGLKNVKYAFIKTSMGEPVKIKP
jgi:large subunit ribosomal protein L1